MDKIKQFYTQSFSSIRYKSKRRGHICAIKKDELIEWLLKNNFIAMWEKYVNSGYNNHLRPSIDRIDDYKGYSFDNMQLLTWRENHIKGLNSPKHRAATTLKNKEKRKPIFQYDLNMNLIATYKSLLHAQNETAIHKNDIIRVCTGKRKTSHGFYFSHIPLNNNFKPKEHNLNKKVIQLTLKDEEIKIWNSITEASKALNLNGSTISAVCRGRFKQTGGFKFRYALTGKELTLTETPCPEKE